MSHRVVYDHIPGPDDYFQTFRVLWEPYTNRVALRFRNLTESANGLVGTPEETIRYLETRAKAGAPWDRGAPLAARRALASLPSMHENEAPAKN